MITPTVKTGQPLVIGTKVGGKRFIFVRSSMYNVPSTKYNVQSRKYGRNAIEINRAGSVK